MVYAFIYARVGNRADAEDLTQQVAMKAIPRLRQGSPASAIRGYLFATARSVLGGFWSTRLGLSESELHDDLAMATPQAGYSEESAERVRRVLEPAFGQLPARPRAAFPPRVFPQGSGG